MHIGQIVTCKDAAFRSDVQLGWYPNRDENQAMVKSYIFTNQSMAEQKSPIAILARIREAFLVVPAENRFLVLATFGHGKSHLALAIANYFGKRADSTEVEDLLDRIKAAFNGAAQAESYRDFKTGRKRHLVICLNGTTFGDDLTTAFTAALKKALDDQPETNGTQLPFWFKHASDFLSTLSEAETKSLTAFLAPSDFDVPTLAAHIADHDQSVYDLVREGFRILRGARPDWGSEYGLDQALQWAVDTFCGDGDEKPFSGVLILFDEFSAFVRNYSKRSMPGAPLQALLDGVANNRRTVVFTAFSQYDPSGWADELSHSHQRDLLLRELERIPKPYRFKLYNNMEVVLDAYLQEDEKELERSFTDNAAWPSFNQASGRAHLLFRGRYEQLAWDRDDFTKVVAKGCFPLHPSATALLCNVEFQEVADARTVLGYVIAQIEAKKEQPVVVSSRPNWVAPFTLVDTFRDQLADEEWKQYEQALTAAGGDITPDQSLVLKGVLLHVIGKLPTSAVSFPTAIADFAQLEQTKVDEALRSLAEAHVISYDDFTKKYSFHPIGGGSLRVKQKIAERLQGRSLTWADVQKLNSEQADELDLAGIPIQVPWGSQDDWAACQFLLPRELCNVKNVKQVVESCGRAVVFWLFAKDTDGVKWFEGDALQSILDEVSGDPSTPVVMLRPSTATPFLYSKLLEHIIVSGFSATENQDFGGTVIQNVRSQGKKALRDQVSALKKSFAGYRVPSLLMAAFQQGAQKLSPSALAKRAVELCYPSAPPSFFEQYKSDKLALRKAIVVVGHLLLQDAVHTEVYISDPVAKQIVENFLLPGGVRAWSLLTASKYIQVPLSAQSKKAWDLIDSRIPPGGGAASVREIIMTLEGPPYGYDVNTATLLFAAWIGFNRYNITPSIAGSIASVGDFAKRLEQGGKPAVFCEFLRSTTAPVKVKRKDPAAEEEAIRKIVEAVAGMDRQPIASDQAGVLAVRLENHLLNPQIAPSERSKLEQTLERLQTARRAAEDYDTAVQAVTAKIESADSPADYLGCLKAVAELPELVGVKPVSVSADVLHKDVTSKLNASVAEVCEKFGNLTNLEDYRRNLDALSNYRSQLKAHLDLQAKIGSAIAALDKQKELIEGKKHDEATMAALNVLAPNGALSRMREDLQTVDKSVCKLPENEAFRKKKKDAFEAAIRELEQFVARLDQRLAATGSTIELSDVLQDVSSKRLLFVDTDEIAVLDAATSGGARISSLLQAVDDATGANLKSIEDFEAKRAALKTFEADKEHPLSEKHLALVKAAIAALEQNAERRSKEALVWLERQEKAAHSSRDASALEAIEHPPAFLPEAVRPRLTALRTAIQQAVQQKRVEDEMRQKDAGILDVVRSVQAVGNIEQLKQSLDLVAGMTLALPESRQIQQRKITEIKEAIEQVSRDLDLQAKQKQDAEVLARLSDIPDTGSLLTLRIGLEKVNSASLLLPANQEIQTRKRKALEAAISERQEFARKITTKVAEVSSVEQAKELLSESTSKTLWFEGAPEHSALIEVVSRSELLQTFFSGLDEIRRADINNPGDIANYEARISEIVSLTEHALSETQLKFIDATRSQLRGKAEAQQVKARQWLDAQQRRFDSGDDLDRLLTDLSAPPAFLPSDKTDALSQLVTAVREKFDADASQQVISHFRKISDPEKRADLIEQLRQLAEEARTN